MNDIAVPFISLFLLDYVEIQFNPYKAPEDIEEQLVKNKLIIYEVEADCYYCFSKVLDGILDNYTDKTPGINNSIKIIK